MQGRVNLAALLRVAGVTVGLAESNGSQPTAGFMTYVTCRLTAKNRDQLRNPTLSNRVRATSTFFYCTNQSCSQYSVIQVPVPVPVPVPMSQVQVQVPVLQFQVPVPVQVFENGT